MGLLGLLRKPAAAAVAGPRAIPGVVHNGQAGVGIFHQGKMVAWGGNETAAWAAHQVATVAKSARLVAVRIELLGAHLQR